MRGLRDLAGFVIGVWWGFGGLLRVWFAGFCGEKGDWGGLVWEKVGEWGSVLYMLPAPFSSP